MFPTHQLLSSACWHSLKPLLLEVEFLVRNDFAFWFHCVLTCLLLSAFVTSMLRGAITKKQTAKVRTLSKPPRPPPVRLGRLSRWICWVDFLDEFGHCEHNTFFSQQWLVSSSNDFFLPAMPFSPTKEVGTSARDPPPVGTMSEL